MSVIKTKVYAGRVNASDILMNSSSGGAYTVLSDIFLDNGDVVVSAVYNYQTHTTEFKMLYCKQERDKALGSKYMQSKPCNIFREAYQWIVQNPDKKILFVGMGCQADGFRKYAELMGIREQVCIVDMVCHGSPSPRLWREYAQAMERRYHGKITYLTFKDKRNGWKAPVAFAVINGREIPIKDYVNVFYSECALRPSCHQCPYATVERKTDMTIGDFWHIEETIPDFYDVNGNSLFLIHTEQGDKLFEKAKEWLEYRMSDTKQCWQQNLEAPTTVSRHRARFWMDYQKRGVRYIMYKYGTTSLKTKVKNKMLSVIKRIKVLYIVFVGGGKILNIDFAGAAIHGDGYMTRRAA